MIFRGHSYRNLDPKGRLMLPPEFRGSLAAGSPEGGAGAGAVDGKCMLTNFDGCIVGYPMPEWEKIEESFRRVNVLDARLRNLQRFVISGAVEVVLDRQGRLLLPPYLRTYAGLDRDVVLAGVGHKFEIWDVARFEERRRQMEASFDSDMASLAESGIELRL